MNVNKFSRYIYRQLKDYAYYNKNQDKLGLSNKEYKRLMLQRRFQKDQTLLFGNTFKMVDAPTFLSSLKEIFVDEIYKFHTPDSNVNIIDCGANIGLATIYFKKLYPAAKVIAFEADPNICDVMRQNVLSFGYKDVEVRNEAVSNTNSFVSFHIEGGHSGMITEGGNAKDVVQIKSTRLKDVIEELDEVTFLKIDIEGHERNVMPDIAEQLKKVKFLFLEYHSFVDSEQQLGEILDIIKSAGFRYYLKEAYNKPFPFINREIFLKMDFLTNIFCYR